MTKKTTPVEAPVVTKLPLPNSDNALVIDLPDGQKLVVGKMATGTVIEVATWRGTGRPDSRTTRLMLGVSSADATPVEDNQAGASTPASKKNPLNQVKEVWSSTSSKVTGFLSSVGKFRKSKDAIEPSSKESVSSSRALSQSEGANDEVQAWLDSIIQRSESKAGVKLPAKASAVKKASTAKKTQKKSTASRRSK
jgi:hypothetical protein